eukprot:jgi/Galph1/610/GphlegSOOS_G5406.1
MTEGCFLSSQHLWKSKRQIYKQSHKLFGTTLISRVCKVHTRYLRQPCHHPPRSAWSCCTADDVIRESMASKSQTREISIKFPSFQPSFLGLVLVSVLSFFVTGMCFQRWVYRVFRIRLVLSIFCGICTFAISWMISSQLSYCSKLQPAEDLLEHDCKLIPIENVNVHLKELRPLKMSDTEIGMVLLHGFGSWLYTYQAIFPSLVTELHYSAIAFDRPGFGLSSRPKALKVYSQWFAGKLSDIFLQRLSTFGVSKRILVGHSMGGLTAALTALEYPYHVDALVLIAPALKIRSQSYKGLNTKGNACTSAAYHNTGIFRFVTTPFGSLLYMMTYSIKYVVRLIRILWIHILFTLVNPVLSLLLSLFVSKAVFWRKGLAMAWYSLDKLTDTVIQQYRIPSLVMDWQQGLIRFILANVGFERQNSVGATPEDQAVFENRDIIQKLSLQNIPILLIHGKNDRIIPVENSFQLAAAIAQAQLVEIPECGHVPQEERPDMVVQAIRNFVQTIIS